MRVEKSLAMGEESEKRRWLGRRLGRRQYPSHHAFIFPNRPSWRNRPGCATGGLQGAGQVAHAPERFGVVGAELGLPKRQRLLAELEGAVGLAGVAVEPGEV